MISYEDFAKIEIRAGKILSAEKIPDTDKLLKLSVDFGDKTLVGPAGPDGVVAPPTTLPPRQIVSGISTYFPDPQVLVGKTCMFVTNLEPRVIKGYESQGMLFALSADVGTDGAPAFSLLEPNQSIPPGTKAK